LCLSILSLILFRRPLLGRGKCWIVSTETPMKRCGAGLGIPNLQGLIKIMIMIYCYQESDRHQLRHAFADEESSGTRPIHGPSIPTFRVFSVFNHTAHPHRALSLLFLTHLNPRAAQSPRPCVKSKEFAAFFPWRRRISGLATGCWHLCWRMQDMDAEGFGIAQGWRIWDLECVVCWRDQSEGGKSAVRN